jgi:hypothetical protein
MPTSDVFDPLGWRVVPWQQYKALTERRELAPCLLVTASMEILSFVICF